MNLRDILASGATKFSFEFFPPKTPASTESLVAAARHLARWKPAFASVTYGAGGSTRTFTLNLVARLKRETDLNLVPHLTCVGHLEAEVREMLDAYAALGVANVLALRGDSPKGQAIPAGDFAHASDLVRFIRAFRVSSGSQATRDYGIGVAGFPEGHPATPNRLLEMDHLKAKVDAGADYICTQLFFENRDFLDFRDRCDLAGIRVPILAGIFPITATTNLRRLAELAGGARFPAKLLRLAQKAGNDAEALGRLGVDYALEQCAELIEHGAAGLHLYTMNQSAAADAICAAFIGDR